MFIKEKINSMNRKIRDQVSKGVLFFSLKSDDEIKI